MHEKTGGDLDAAGAANAVAQRDFFFELYKVAVEEVHKYHNLHHHRVLYFSGLVTTILGAASFALVRSTTWVHYAFVGVALFLLIQVCQVGRVGISGAYRLLLESISVRAKLEQALALTEPGWCPGLSRPDVYWSSEALVPTRHLEDRRAHSDSSTSWQTRFFDEGDQRWPVRFLIYSEILGAFLLVATCALALSEWMGS